MTIQKIIVPAGATLQHIVLLPEQALQFDFATDAASFERTDNNLSIAFENGATIVIDDFFITDGEELPPFILPDGTPVSGAEFLASRNPDMDLETAAGPDGSSSSGAGEYSSDAGSLVEGIDGLESLASDGWVNPLEQGIAQDQLTPILGGAVGTGTIAAGEGEDGGDGENPGGDQNKTLYDARVVLYGGVTAGKFHLVDGFGNRLGPAEISDFSFEFAGETSGYFTNLVLNADGSVSFSLTPEGIEFLNNSDSEIAELVTLTVNGESYTTQLLAKAEGNTHDSEEEGQISNNGGDLNRGEWHYISSTDPVSIKGSQHTDNIAEFSNGMSGSFASGSGNDTITIKKSSTDGEINVGAGNNSVDITGTALRTNITAGSGDDTITLHGAMTGGSIHSGDGENSITVKGSTSDAQMSTGSGNDSISLRSVTNSAISLGDGENTVIVSGTFLRTGITSGSGNDTITIKGSSTDGEINAGDGSNSIDITGTALRTDIAAGSGDDTITLHGAMTNGSIHAGAGNNSVSIAKDVSGGSLSSSGGNDSFSIGGGFKNGASLSTGEGKDTATIGANLEAAKTKHNTIAMGDGENTLSVNGDITSVATGSNSITMGNGINTINIGDVARGGGGLFITMGDGDNTINANKMYNSGKEAETKISAGSGKLTLNSQSLTTSSGSSLHITGSSDVEYSTDVDIKGYVGAGSSGSKVVIGGELIEGENGDLTFASNKSLGTVTVDYTGSKEHWDTLFKAGGGFLYGAAKNFTLKGNSASGSLHGVTAETGGRTEFIFEDTFNLEVLTDLRSSTTQTTGLLALKKGSNTITSTTEDGKVVIDVNAKGSLSSLSDWSSIGMYAKTERSGEGAYNTINANNVSLTVSSAASNAFGMGAETGGLSPAVNRIESLEDNAITVIIKTSHGSYNGKKAIAMWAKGADSLNEIIGHSTKETSDSITLDGDLYANRGANIIRTGSGDDIIRITGNIESSGRGADVYGAKIDTGAGNDFISITGDIRDTSTLARTDVGNEINMGEGNDVLHLNGSIKDIGSLHVTMGEGGYDTVILSAASQKAFMDQYGKWLSGGGLKNADVESIHINFNGETSPSEEEINNLIGYLGNNIGEVDITYSIGNTLYLDNINADEMSLSGFLASLDGSPLLDFTGNEENVINLDKLLEGVSLDQSLKIKGDEHDSIEFSDAWKIQGGADSEGYIELNNGSHSIYVHGELLNNAFSTEALDTLFLTNTL